MSFDPLTAECQAWDHKVYYPGAHRLTLRVTGDRRSGRLLGAQIVGHHQAQVAKRIDIFASALFEALTVEAVNDLDLSYTALRRTLGPSPDRCSGMAAPSMTPRRAQATASHRSTRSKRACSSASGRCCGGGRGRHLAISSRAVCALSRPRWRSRW
jgi:hypothetical protein